MLEGTPFILPRGVEHNRHVVIIPRGKCGVEPPDIQYECCRLPSLPWPQLGTLVWYSGLVLYVCVGLCSVGFNFDFSAAVALCCHCSLPEKVVIRKLIENNAM